MAIPKELSLPDGNVDQPHKHIEWQLTIGV